MTRDIVGFRNADLLSANESSAEMPLVSYEPAPHETTQGSDHPLCLIYGSMLDQRTVDLQARSSGRLILVTVVESILNFKRVTQFG